MKEPKQCEMCDKDLSEVNRIRYLTSRHHCCGTCWDRMTLEKVD